ncbi:MAG: HNH endonuclease [Gemmataceae bacterium]
MAQLKIYGYAEDKTKKVVAVSEIDDAVLPLAERHSWFMVGEYAAASINGATKPLHYFVWEHFKSPDSVPDELQLDHLNQNKLDNRIENLVFVNDRVKQANAPKHRDNTSGFKGVSQQNDGRFCAIVGRDNKQNYLGRYATSEEAAYAVNLGYAKLHPEVPTPNLEADALLTAEQKMTVEGNVQRLTRPGRLPNQS